MIDAEFSEEPKSGVKVIMNNGREERHVGGAEGRAGCSFGATEGDSMAASREWCLPDIPRSPCSAEA